MSSLATIRASNSSFTWSYFSIAAVGRTSGIGRRDCGSLRADHERTRTYYFIGSNCSVIESIISSLPNSTIPGGATHEFIERNVTCVKNIDAATKDLLCRVTKINYLVMTPGIVTMSRRDEMQKGIDKKPALYYYARWKFIHGPLPVLKKAKEDGEDAGALTVLGAGGGGEVDVNDLVLKSRLHLGCTLLT